VALSSINLGNLLNGIASMFGSGTTGMIIGGVLIVIIGVVYFYVKNQIAAAQQAAAAAQAAATAAAAHAAAIAASQAQESQIASDQTALAQEAQTKLLALLQSMPDDTLCTAAAQAFGQSKIQALLGEQIPVLPLTPAERSAIYALYGVGGS
jgi:predicted lipid-binding transport protein (Tim44 family)